MLSNSGIICHQILRESVVFQLIGTYSGFVLICGKVKFDLTECANKALKGLFPYFSLIELTFPNDDDVPAKEFQGIKIFQVTGLVAFDLCLPEIDACAWHHEIFAAHSSPTILDG